MTIFGGHMREKMLVQLHINMYQPASPPEISDVGGAGAQVTRMHHFHIT